MSSFEAPKISFGHYGHIGTRERNEDDLFHLAFTAGNEAARLVAVADGMGGNRLGEIASRTAVSAATSYLVDILRARGDALAPQFLESCLRQAMKRANRAILDLSNKGRPGSTLTLGLFTPHHVAIGHIGDTRAGVCVNGSLQPLTRDHATPEGALERRLGLMEEIEPDIEIFNLLDNAMYLFTSDGVHGFLGEETIMNILSGTPTPNDACVQLVHRALENAGAGADNLSAIIVEIGVYPRTSCPSVGKNERRILRATGLEISLATGNQKAPETRRSKRRSLTCSIVLILGIAFLCGLLAFLATYYDPLRLFSVDASDASGGLLEQVGREKAFFAVAVGLLTAIVVGLGLYLIKPSKH